MSHDPVEALNWIVDAPDGYVVVERDDLAAVLDELAWRRATQHPQRSSPHP